MNKDRLLMEWEGGWSIYAWDAAKFPHEEQSFLTHACAKRENVYEVYVFPDSVKNCWRCCAPIPDELRALWILHNGHI
jgi:hypothetical protein